MLSWSLQSAFLLNDAPQESQSPVDFSKRSSLIRIRACLASGSHTILRRCVSISTLSTLLSNTAYPASPDSNLQDCQPFVHIVLRQHLVKVFDGFRISRHTEIITMTKHPTIQVHVEEESSIALAAFLERVLQYHVCVVLLPHVTRIFQSVPNFSAALPQSLAHS